MAPNAGAAEVAVPNPKAGFAGWPKGLAWVVAVAPKLNAGAAVLAAVPKVDPKAGLFAGWPKRPIC